MSRVLRERLPDWPAYAEREGMKLIGKGNWRATLCYFHDDSKPSMRVNVGSGGWVCMSCGVKGGDVLAHYMRRTGTDFVEAARHFGAWEEGGAAPQRRKPTSLSARDAMELVAFELTVALVVISDVKRGIKPGEEDWKRFLRAFRRIGRLVMEFQP